jgi:DNA-binding winged helix-turn-helix (wHTH) protein/Flp pilus assembly protein TadD
MDAHGGALYRGDQRLPLPPKAVDVLRLLLAAGGEVVTRTELLHDIWPDVVVEEGNLSKLVYILRQVLADVPEYAEAIQTVPKRGYRFVGSLREYLGDHRQSLETPTWRDGLAPKGTARTTVAVLPLRILTRNDDDTFLSLALADALTNRLASLPHLRVRPIAAVGPFVKDPLDPVAASRRHDVEVIVEGSVQRVADRVRVHLQIWGERGTVSVRSLREEAELSNLFPLEDRLGAGLAEVFRAPTGKGERSVPVPLPGPKNPIAYSLYLRASDCLIRYDPSEVRKAIALLEQVTTLEPDFAAGWARLSAAALIVGSFFEFEDHWTKRAEEAARRALALKPGDSDAHCALGRTLWTPVNSFQHHAALESFGDALRLNPNCQQALTWFGGVLSHVGLLAEAKEYLLEALTISPYDGAALAMLGQNAVYENQLDEAGEVFARALSEKASEFMAVVQRPGVSLYAGELDRAEREIKAAREIGPEQPMPDGHEALLWALRGEASRAETFIARSLQCKMSLGTHHAWHHAAAAAAILGQVDRAIDILERASETGLPNYPAFRNDRYLARLQGVPRFQSLLSRLEKDWLDYRRDFGGMRPQA